MRPFFGSNQTLSAFRQPPMYLSSTLKMPGRAGNLSVYLAATFLSTGRKPYCAKRSCAVAPFTKRMNLFATSLFGELLRTAIGSSISIVCRGITYWMFWPFARAASASLSYVMRTSPLPERNVFVALRPEVSCETTCLKSCCTYAVACLSDLPRRRWAPYAARTFHFAEPELNGFGVTTCTPGRTRSLQPLMCFGLPLRTAKTTTVSAAIPSYDWRFHVGLTRPASTRRFTSSPVERNTRSAGCPAATARAWFVEGP